MRPDKRGPCPCESKLALRECCGRFHEGQEPPDPSTLVRARYSAFCLGRAEFLWRTLDPEHPLRGQDQNAVLRELRQARETLRYRGLTIHEARIDGERAQVLFTVRVFRGGRDRSFMELSEFRRHEGAWRYLAGETRAPMVDPSFASFRS